MPFYEYECSACKFYVEALQKISDPPLRKCPSCKKQTMQRLVSAPNFRLKGGGWYETDFKSDKEEKRNLAAGEEAADSKAEAPKEPAADAKDAKPAEAKPAEAKAEKGEPKKTAAAKPAAKAAAKAAAKPAAKPKARAKAPARKK
jgi:putative FmdB family regulatory protein